MAQLSASEASIAGLQIIQAKRIDDERGSIRELFRESAFRELGIPPVGPFRQINLTESARGTIRGLHGEQMHKLVTVVKGGALGAYVDARPGSATFGHVETVRLEVGIAVWVPPGVCNGFQATDDRTQYLYAFDAEWSSGMAGVAIHALDPALAIQWPLPVDPNNRAQLSAKDACLPCLADLM